MYNILLACTTSNQITESILATTRYQSLTLFTTIYGIGPFVARKLYDIGLRDIQDLEQYFDAPSRSTELKLGLENTEMATKNGWAPFTVPVGLSLREDLSRKCAVL
jgi:hypothetical protein